MTPTWGEFMTKLRALYKEYPTASKQYESDYDALLARLAEAERDAALGRIAMRFVDRAGDVCDEDTARTICAEFYNAMANAVERQREARGLPAARLTDSAAAVTRKVVPPGWRDVLDHARQTLGAGGGVGQAWAANAELERKIGEPLIDFIEEELAAADSASAQESDSHG